MFCIRKMVLCSLAICMILFCAGCGEDEVQSASDETVLHITCWIDDMELDRLIALFEETHPDVTVEVTAYYDNLTESSAAMSRMNVEIVTDGTADLFYLENAIDVMSLVNAGLLQDLYPLMEADTEFLPEDYYENVWEAMELDGSLYEISGGFQIGAIAAPKSLVGDRSGWTIDEYQAFASQLEEPFLLQSRSAMLYQMTAYALFDYIDVKAGTCSFDSPSFQNWLEFIKTFPEDVDNNMDALAAAPWTSGIYSYLQEREAFGDIPQYVGFPCDSAIGPCVEALTSFGISSQTEQAELCWEFIKTMLSEEYQEQVVEYSAFPMRKSVLEAQLANAMLPSTDENSLIDADSLLGPLSQKEADALKDVIQNLSTARFRYRDIEDMIEEDAESFFCGDKSVQEVTQIIQNRAGIYLSERS